MNYNTYERLGKSYNNRFVDLNGRPIKRTPFSHPYSYEEYVIWKGDYNENNDAVYSDRLYSWDSEKYNECCQKVFNDKRQIFNGSKPEDIEKFLSLYFEKEIKLTAIVQGCNAGNGYPYWAFCYEYINK